ncbi:MAG: drug/metabolite transporter, family [Solirubrobacteraceae bacterium]|nr:drug/metabolite transporter, family [Solirubrobacteraceae bacterium]
MARIHVLVAAVLFGTTGTAQALVPGAAPLQVGAARIAVGALLLAAAARWLASSPRTGGRWPRRELAAATVGIAGYQLAFFAAVSETGVAVGTVVALGSAPALTGALAYAVDRERLTGRWAACTALATAGVLLLVLAGADAEVSPGGVGLALCAGASYALYTVASKRLLSLGHGPEEVMARGFGAAAIVLVPVLLARSPDWLGHADRIALAVYLGAVPTALAYVLFARGLRHLTAGETSTLTLAEPLTAAALGALVLAERPGALAIAGAALVLTGLVALAAPATRRPVTANA